MKNLKRFYYPSYCVELSRSSANFLKNLEAYDTSFFTIKWQLWDQFGSKLLSVNQSLVSQSVKDRTTNEVLKSGGKK